MVAKEYRMVNKHNKYFEFLNLNFDALLASKLEYD